VRDFYVERLEREIKEQRAAGHEVIIEPAYLDENGSVAREGPLRLPARADIIVAATGSALEALQIDTEKMLGFTPFSFQWSDSLTVECRPFQWNWCEVTLAPAENISFPSLTSWFNDWFRGEEESGATEVIGAVHFMSDPERNDANVHLAIDLGSAPVASVEAFFDAAGQAGASRVTLGAAT
jgi:hypothetical protein